MLDFSRREYIFEQVYLRLETNLFLQNLLVFGIGNSSNSAFCTILLPEDTFAAVNQSARAIRIIYCDVRFSRPYSNITVDRDVNRKLRNI